MHSGQEEWQTVFADHLQALPGRGYGQERHQADEPVSGGYKMMFLFGVLLGMITGVMVMALMAVARDDDDQRNGK